MVRARAELARVLAIAAARRTLRLFPGPLPCHLLDVEPRAGRGTLRADAIAKGDGSPVTAADRDAEAFLRDEISSKFPGDAILGEEFGEQAGRGEPTGFRWIVDPIDGTVSFVHGVPLFGTIVGVEYRGRPVAGVIAMPVMDEVVWGGVGLGAWHEVGVFAGREKPMVSKARVTTVARLKDATIVTTSLDYFAKVGRSALYEPLQRACAATRGWSDCYGFVLAVTGRTDAVVEPLVKPWDICGVAAIVDAAGGKWTDCDGNASIETGHCVVSNGLVHEELLRVLTPR